MRMRASALARKGRVGSSGGAAPRVTRLLPTQSTFGEGLDVLMRVLVDDASNDITSIKFYLDGAEKYDAPSPPAVGGTFDYTYLAADIPASGSPYELKAIATDALGNSNETIWQITISDLAPVNVALATNGAIATASSVYTFSPGDFTAKNAINGDRTGANWGTPGWSGWVSAAYAPGWLAVDFGVEQSIFEIDVIGLSKDYPATSEPTLDDIYPNYGILDCHIEYWTGSAWATIPGGAVTGNNKVWQRFTFDPISTSAIRLTVDAMATSPGLASCVEFEAWSLSPTPIPPRVAITAPTDAVSTPSITIEATITAALGAVVNRVQLYRDGALINSVTGLSTTSYSYSFEDTTASPASQSFDYQVIAYDDVNTLQGTAQKTVFRAQRSGNFSERKGTNSRVALDFTDASQLGVEDSVNQGFHFKPISYAQAYSGGLTIHTTGGPEGLGFIRATRPWWLTSKWSGQFRVHYSDTPGGNTYNADFNYGEGVRYEMFWVRVNQQMIDPFYDSNGDITPGWKVCIEGAGDRVGMDHGLTNSCSGPEIVLNVFSIGTANRALNWYHGCQVSAQFTNNNLVIQNQRPAPYCSYPNYQNCQVFRPGVWALLKLRHENGPYDSASGQYLWSTQDIWYGDEDTYPYLLHSWDTRRGDLFDKSQLNPRGCIGISPALGNSWGCKWKLDYMTANAAGGIQPRAAGTPDATMDWSGVLVKDVDIPFPTSGIGTNYSPNWLTAIKNDPAKKNTVQIIPGSVWGNYDLRSSWDTAPIGQGPTQHADIIVAYAGCAMDPFNFGCHLVASGGHQASSVSNPIHSFDAATNDDTQRWRRTRDGTFVIGGGEPAENLTAYFPSTPPYDQPAPGNGPVSRHTYYSLGTMRNPDKSTELFMAYNGAATHDGLTGTPSATDSAVLAADRRSAQYRPAGTWQLLPEIDAANNSVLEKPCAADDANNAFYVYCNLSCYRANNVTKNWTQITDDVGLGNRPQKVPLVMDRARNKLVLFGRFNGQGVHVLDLANPSSHTFYGLTGPAAATVAGQTNMNSDTLANCLNAGATHVYNGASNDYYVWATGSTLIKVHAEPVGGNLYCETLCSLPIPIQGGLGFFYNRIAYIPKAFGILIGPLHTGYGMGFVYTGDT